MHLIVFCLISFVVTTVLTKYFIDINADGVSNEASHQPASSAQIAELISAIASLSSQVLELKSSLSSMERQLSATNLSLSEQVTQLRNEMIDQFFKLHDENHVKVEVLKSCSISAEICDSKITAHYVLYEKYMFGVSIAHTPCFVGDVIPESLLPCDGIDVTLWKGRPPPSVSLLNITGRIAKANVGDSALAFGFSNDVARSWQGAILGKLGYNTSGRHFTTTAYEHHEELLFSGAQDAGMSGAGVLNGRGYLGVCRAVLKDNMKNLLPVVTPWSLISQCMKNNKQYLHTFKNIDRNTILNVPMGIR
mmetsp:Transcript_10257/g.14112  ORF Transcript_10257/g.14112 Transcript_10257/m.14112 type:complete len:307 (+) Transcript_10257:16-936(+)